MRLLASSTHGAQIFQLLCLVGTMLSFYIYGLTFDNCLLVLLGYFLYGCLGIVVTYHRYLTHKSYVARPILVKLFSILGCMAGTGSPIAWVAIHINHHLKSDKPNDPHSPLYKGLNIFKLEYEHEVDNDTKWRMRELVTDKFQQFLHRFYFLIIFVYGLILYGLGGFYLVSFLLLVPALITGIMSNVVNYVGHMPNMFGGFRSHNLNDRSTNNWLWAIPSWGEAWHNNHHRFPRNSYFGQHWYEVDISGIVINLIKVR